MGETKRCSPDSGCAIFGSGSALLHGCRLAAAGPLERSPNRPPRFGRPSFPPRAAGASAWPCRVSAPRCGGSQPATVLRAGVGAQEIQGQVQTPLPTAAGGPTGRTKATSRSVHSHRSARGHRARPASPSELMSADTSLPWAGRPVRACVGQCPCPPHLTPRPFSWSFHSHHHSGCPGKPDNR